MRLLCKPGRASGHPFGFITQGSICHGKTEMASPEDRSEPRSSCREMPGLREGAGTEPSFVPLGKSSPEWPLTKSSPLQAHCLLCLLFVEKL